MIYYNNIKFNMFCSYVCYNCEVLDWVMFNDIIYVMILCDLVFYFEFIFLYMMFGEILGIFNEIDFLKVFFENLKDVLVNYLFI